MTTNASIEQPAFGEHGALPVHNAGLVLLHNHLLMLFDMCGYLHQRKLKDMDTAHRAVRLLQFLATGHEKAKEDDLLFNKLLCGIPFSQTIDETIVLLENEKALCHKLLRSIITQWPILNDTSVDGLRGAFIMRAGMLDESAPDKIILKVKKEGYDLLLDKIPWTYSTVCLPWMPRTLHTHWR